MASNNPRHGEGIIERREDTLGGIKFVASRQFQQFLDDLSDLFLADSDDGEQDFFSVSVQIGTNTANIRATTKELEDLVEHLSAIDVENSRLKALIKSHVDAFDDLEQVVYGS